VDISGDRVSDDPYGLPRFPGDDALPGWTDHSEIALRTVRVFTRGARTATVIAHPGVWDVILSDGAGGVEFYVLQPDEIAELLRSRGDGPSMAR
jgi:hypothetical protein